MLTVTGIEPVGTVGSVTLDEIKAGFGSLTRDQLLEIICDQKEALRERWDGTDPSGEARRIPCKVVFDERGEFAYAMPVDEPEKNYAEETDDVRDGWVEVGG